MALPSLSPRISRSAQQRVEQLKELVSFRIAQEHFGVDILVVQEIIRLPEITPIPNAPVFILGVINLRGRIIPVVDLRRRLKIQGKAPDSDTRKTRILIVELHNHVTGFIVDAVPGIMKVPLSEIEPTPDLLVSSIDAEYIKGVIKLSDHLVVLLDFQKILKSQEKKELQVFEQETLEGGLGQEDFD